MTAPWVPCPCCECFICTIHSEHAHDCPCPPAEDWPRSPYDEPARYPPADGS